jgi:hypothetical protein
MVARATTYSGKVARIVHVFSEEALAVNAEHCKKWKKTRKKICTRMSTRTITSPCKQYEKLYCKADQERT